MAYCVLASSPENVLFVLGVGVGVEWVERTLSKPSFPRKLRSLSHPRLHLGVCLYILTCLNRPRQEGGVFAHTAHSVLAFYARRHGGSRRIRTSSLAYEASELPLLHHCDINEALWFIPNPLAASSSIWGNCIQSLK